jgi:hypothetical protein
MAFTLVHYSQQDPRWQDHKLGPGPETIGYIGCALTSVAMYASGWGFAETPDALNQKLKDSGGYIGQGIVWGAITKFYPQLKCTGLTICGDSPAPLAQIGGSLAAGQPVIVEVDFSPAVGLQTHWILLYASLGNDYLMLDPWPYPTETGQVTLMSRFSHGKTLQRAILAVAWYQSSLVTAPPGPGPGPAPIETDLYIWPLASVTAGLRLRPQPSQDAPAVYAEMPRVRLNVIEAKGGALAKIGQQGQWIYVRDPQGHQGYVAAWFVEQVPADAPPSTPVPPPASEPKRFQVIVLNSVGASGLAVREQPSRGAAKVNIEKPGARLTVLEPASTGIPKIGVAGQWLPVKATNSKRGYVAAQYVQLKS